MNNRDETISAAARTDIAAKRARELLADTDAKIPNAYRSSAYHRARWHLMRAAEEYQSAPDALIDTVHPRDYERERVA